MRCVAWNCNGALARKLPALLALHPDVAIVSEAAHPEMLREQAGLFTPSSAAWVGENRSKGLLVLGFGPWQVRLDARFDPAMRWIAPVHVDGPTPFRLLAVWAANRGDNFDASGRGPLLRALASYADFLSTGPLVVAGDFNHNVRWDETGSGCRNRHSDAVERLAKQGTFSAYHASRGVEQGQEPEPTIYWRDRKKDGPAYHIDYVFLPELWRSGLQAVTLGTFEEWVQAGLSDHVPLIVDVDPGPTRLRSWSEGEV